MSIDIDMRVRIGALELASPVLPASGTFGSGREYAQFVDLARLGAVVTKGVSLEPWPGNPQPRIVETASGMLNSIGLQNPGVEAFCSNDLAWLAAQGVPVIVNVSGHSIEEYVAVARRLDREPAVCALELNISCPNVDAGGIQFGTSCDSASAVTGAVRAVTGKPLIVKLSPNVTDIAEIARAVEAAGADAVSLVNTLLGMAIDVDSQRCVLPRRVGGLSGPAIKPVALRMVWDVYEAVSVPIIGMGGIATPRDAIEFMLAGATAVAVGTANFVDPVITVRIADGIEAYCRDRGIERVADLTGAAHDARPPGNGTQTVALAPPVQEQQRPEPAPLPPSPPKRRTAWGMLAVGLLVVAVIGSCAGTIWFFEERVVPWLEADADLPEELSEGVAGFATEHVVQWSGDGRYVVGQYRRSDGTHGVLVVDASTQRGRALEGFRLLFVEPEAPVAWVEPVDLSDADPNLWVDGARDSFDRVPDRLVAWRFDTDAAPKGDASAKWHDLAGPGGFTAQLEVDPLMGAGPARLLFVPSDRATRPIEAALPEEMRTFVPVGWSSSGRYFAIEELVSVVEGEEEVEDPVGKKGRRLLVFDPRDGSVVAESEVPSFGIAPASVWLGASDRLVWFSGEPSDSQSTRVDIVLMALTVGSRRAERLTEPEWDLPPDIVADVMSTWGPCGWDPEGPLMFVSDRILRATPEGLKDLGSRGVRTVPSWHPGSGLVWLDKVFLAEGRMQSIVTRADEHGGSRTVLWRGVEETDVWRSD